MTLIVDYTLRPALFHVISKGFLKQSMKQKLTVKARDISTVLWSLSSLKVKTRILHKYKYKTEK